MPYRSSQGQVLPLRHRYSVVWSEDAIPQLSRRHDSVLALLDAYYGEMQVSSWPRHAGCCISALKFK